MATNIRDGYMSPQVWVAKREQKVIEILDRLVPARVEYAENIFAGEKYLENGMVKREYALLTMVICEGKNRQIRRMCAYAGLTVLRLKRVREGAVRLGKLPVGQWRYLTGKEISALRGK